MILKECNSEKNAYHMQRLEALTAFVMNEHARVLAFGLDLSLPQHNQHKGYESAVITRFIASLKAQIVAYLKRRSREGKRIYPCPMYYAWAREFGELNGNKHYHLVLLVNREVFSCMMLKLGVKGTGRGLLLTMAAKAWSHALKLKGKAKEKVSYHLAGVFELNRKEGTHSSDYEGYLKRICYLAKKRSKENDDGERNFGCSQFKAKAKSNLLPEK
ncbi:inovirus Gp2 family protein [Citrobacter sp. Awk 4]|uniref:inovirus Gp2 family protein n=1 Tax=Citrobacter sp. Awk 4 TaxID=2963955 RepID=UPI002303BFE1|nr:inovirus Gp2 family protein [Citrobacter sp. Awk 4]MDA8478114.1 inovirus Gp2 family protein [Citrobacter sp. Awk 4]